MDAGHEPADSAARTEASSEQRVGRIVEVEAYIGEEDRASHARFGRTARNQVMYGRPGVAYVYLVYGMYHCLNVVTEPAGRPAALLIRAAEPVAGQAAMRTARAAARTGVRRARTEPPRREGSVRDERLASGPGVLCAAFSITRADTGLDLLDPASPLRLELPEVPLPAGEVVATPRVGIAYAPEPWRSMAWRFADRSSPALSASRPKPGAREIT